MKVKYIKTDENTIIIFSEYLSHDDFESFKPVSAGFISIGVDENFSLSCVCYGESISLGLKSEEIDSILAGKQILGLDY